MAIEKERNLHTQSKQPLPQNIQDAGESNMPGVPAETTGGTSVNDVLEWFHGYWSRRTEAFRQSGEDELAAIAEETASQFEQLLEERHLNRRQGLTRTRTEQGSK